MNNSGGTEQTLPDIVCVDADECRRGAFKVLYQADPKSFQLLLLVEFY